MDASPAPDSRRRALALIITGAAVFMVTLDNLVVTNALPSIRADLGASISQLGWFVNAYTLTFAALLLTGRLARRPLRAPARVRARPRDLHRRLAGAALATSSGLADRGAQRAGPRRRARHAAQPDAAGGRVPGRTAAASRSASGRA